MVKIAAVALLAGAVAGAPAPQDAPAVPPKVDPIPAPPNIMGWLGVMGGTIGVVSWIHGLIEADYKKYRVGSTMRIGAGSGITKEQSMAGKAPQIEVYDSEGIWTGHHVNWKERGMRDGEATKELRVAHKRQCEYTIFNSRFDPLCVSFVSTKYHDRTATNSMSYAVIGEFGKYCGARWYESQFQPYPGNPWKTACMWIGPSDSGHHTGFQVRWPGFYAGENTDLATRLKNNETIDPTELCDGITFGLRMEHHPSVLIFNNTNTGRIEYMSPGNPGHRTRPRSCIDYRDDRSQRDRDMDPNFREQCFSRDKVTGRFYSESWFPGWVRTWIEQIWAMKCKVPEVGFCPILARPISGSVLDIQKPDFKDRPDEPKKPKGDMKPEEPEDLEEPSLVRRDDWMTQQLTVSNHESHSARRLCESDMSHGPDFAHDEERLFCEMGSKTLYPFCGGPDGDGPTTDCFDAETRTLVDTGRRYKRDAAPVAGYLEVRDWRTSKARYD
ncbi:hypothetical protein PLICBS_007702 [Purpureocillium lilacinum]|uniref:uncharacterized protein n=1 Tax=Purpureocillium lilacinum TaxID=33203 RepID=UPI002088D624|nr:hypothetical protein PLICBS_007702 [Purpureocillium lilacinum]